VPAPEPGTVLDLREPRRIHVVGVGGAGMSAYAAILAELGHRVSGSDLHEHPRLERLRLLGVDCLVPQTADNVPPDADAVVFSTAVPRTNVEVVAAEKAGIPVLSRADALAGIVATRRALGVAGTHGKTTTTSMITLILRAADLRPSFLVGSELNEVGSNAGLDSGEWLVVEADESDGTFLRLGLDAAIVTNVDVDHLWYWGDMQRLEDAFRRFVDGVDGPVVLCADDARTRALAAGRERAITYGWAEDAHYRATEYRGGREGSSFVLERDGTPLGEIRLPITGRHNAQNATAAAAITLELGVGLDAVQRALASFGGVARRFQHRGELDGVTIIDDYALLPPEIQATIRAASEGDWGRIIAVFQPFRYSRTAIMWEDFADAFVGADQVILTDVCGFHEQPIPGVTGHLILNAVLDAHPELAVAYFPHRAELVKLVPTYARPGDLVLTLGGGDITTLADELLVDGLVPGAGE
jgi:UDP-N-acetylmuramate--alanine ligase